MFVSVFGRHSKTHRAFKSDASASSATPAPASFYRTLLGPGGLVVAFALLARRFLERSLRAVDFMIVRRAAAWMSLDAAIACRDSAVADTLV